MKEQFVITQVDSNTLAVNYVYIPYFDSYSDALMFVEKLPEAFWYQINKIYVRP